jgi:hypothetical protein
MTRLDSFVKTVGLVIGLAVVGSAVFNSDVHARGGYCVDSGHACHVIIDLGNGEFDIHHHAYYI